MKDINKQKSEVPEVTGKKQVKDTRFQPGQSGNPAGRPLGTISITSEIKKKLKEIPEGQKKTYLETFIIKIMKKAMVDEDEKMIKLIWNYIDGMPRQKHEVEAEVKIEKELSQEDKDLISEALNHAGLIRRKDTGEDT